MDELEPRDLVAWLHAQVDRDERFAASDRDHREVRMKRMLINRCAEYIEEVDDPAHDVALDVLGIVAEVYEGNTDT